MNPPSLTTIPEGLDVIDAPDGVVIRKRWFTWAVIPMALFAVVWDSFLFFFYTMIFKSPHTPWAVKLFPIGHLAVGVFITYSVFTTLFNRTDVAVSSGGVRVFKGPLPWPGNREVRREDLDDVLVRTRSGSNNANGNRGMSYAVMSVDRQRKEHTLLGGISQSEQAEFTAATIRQRLGLRSVSA